LERLDEFLIRKRRMGARYDAAFSTLPAVQRPLAETAYASNAYWIYGLVLDEERNMKAEEAMHQLATQGIGTRPFFCPMHWQPVLRRLGLFEGESYPVAERLYTQGFYIPSGLGLTDVEQDRVCKAVMDTLA
jgi:perosamine synthetase